MSHTTSTPPGASEVPRRRTDDVLGTLADKVGARFTAANVFGEPVERGGVTVIPVAVARFGVGGGSGSDPTKGQNGEGGGAGGMATPTGYIELKDGRTRFVPVVNPARMLLLVAGATLAGLALLRPVLTRSAPRAPRALPWR